MPTNRIGSRRIADRLGRSGLDSRDGEDPRPPSERPGNGNLLFACLVVVIFLVGAGIGIAGSGRSGDLRRSLWASLVGPPPPPPYRSRVADTCDRGWKDDRFNRDQIHCHMTMDVARLCDPRERRALVVRLVDYQTAMDRVNARLNVAAFKIIANPAATLQMGISDARSRDPRLTEKQRAEQFGKTMEMSHQIMSPAEEVQRDNINIATKKDLVGDVKILVERGYLAATDFSSLTQPKIVKEGLAAASHVDRPFCS